MAEVVDIRLLGTCHVSRGGETVRGFESRKALAMLAYLAEARQPVARDSLADLLWPEKGVAQAHANLSRVLHNLNHLLPERLVVDRQRVHLPAGPGTWIDTVAFDDLAAVASVVAGRAAADLYRGDFVAGLALKDCADLELWLFARRDHWRTRVADLLAGLAHGVAAEGELPAAVDLLRRLLALEPWREEAHRELIWFLGQLGQRGAALAQYAACVTALRDELGVDPDPATTQVMERVRRGEVPAPARGPAADGQARGRLPLHLTRFVGRRQELDALGRRLRDPACRLLTLVGPGGSGKSRLAAEAGAALGRAFADGSWFVPLGALTRPELLATTIAGVVGCDLEGAEPPAEQVARFLAPRQALLILDEFENLMEGTDLVLDLLRTAPLLKVLVTSRSRLNLQAEWLLSLDGLSLAQEASPAGPGSSEAAQLFLDRARHLDPRFDRPGAERVAIEALCRLVDGLPLAIELAAAQVEGSDCATLAAALGDNLDLLATTMRDVPPQHRSVRAVFDHSWRGLPAAGRQILARLALFHGGFDPAAAAAVAGASAADLALLERHSLVRAGPGERRDLHELLRRFAFEALSEAEIHQAREAHAAHFGALAQAAEQALNGPEQAAWLVRLDDDLENLRAALDWLWSQEDFEAGARLVTTLWRYWLARGHLTEIRGWAERLLAGEERAGNAPTETFFTIHRLELVRDAIYLSRAAGLQRVFEHLEGYYNRIRRRSARGDVSPAEFELVQHRESSCGFSALARSRTVQGGARIPEALTTYPRFRGKSRERECKQKGNSPRLKQPR